LTVHCLLQCLADPQGGLLDRADDLQLLLGRVSHVASSPSPIKFFQQAIFQHVLGQGFFQLHGLLPQCLNLSTSCLAFCVARQPLAASLQKLLLLQW